MSLAELTPDELEYLVEHMDRLPVYEQEELKAAINTLEKRNARQAAQKDFLTFMRTVEPSMLQGPQHKIIGDLFNRIAAGTLKRVIINIAPRHALRLGTLVPTTRGMVVVEDLKTGDMVFGPDGLPTAVTGKSDVFCGRELYRVWTDDKASVDVDGEHLWTVRLHRKYGAFKEYTTEQLWHRQNGAYLRTKRGGGVEVRFDRACTEIRLPMLPAMSATQHTEKQLPIDPYVLGVWLGDGTSDSSNITMSDEDFAVVGAEIRRRGYTTTSSENVKYRHSVNMLRPLLRKLGVLNNKHIPDIYLRGSEAQRRDLLKGLMDTDGNVSAKGQCFFAQSNKPFIEQVATLVRSLGIKASIIETNAVCNGKDCGSAWKLSFYASDIAHLPRKEERTLKNEREFGRYIRIEKLDVVGDTQCITVDRDDGLFMVGEGHIVTHNSKSTISSYLLPAWFMGQFPQKQIIMASHTADLAVDFGRKVRNLVASPIYSEVFPGVNLAADSKAAGRWNTTAGGIYLAIGVGGAMAGRGGDLVIIDDPHSEQEAKSGNPAIFDEAYEWYQSGPRQRLMPNGAIVVLMCMVGGTDVLMADGTSTKLRDIRPGDEVATFERGEITTSRVNNWMSSGVDTIYTIQTQSGIILQANERHPFLVDFDGEKKWTRLRDLKPGMLLVATKDAIDRHEAKQNPDYATHAKQWSATTNETLTLHTEGLDITASGKESSVSVANPCIAKDCAQRAIENNSRQPNPLRKKQGQAASNTGTESQPSSSTLCCKSKTASAPCAVNPQPQKTQEHTGTASCALTTATTQIQSEGYCATTATLQLDMVKLQKSSNEPLSTYVVFLDEIVSIVESGREEVFDVEIDRTENFIANGVVSHNTRWNKRDLTGRLIDNMVRSPDGDMWEVVELPAILPSGQPLWPEFWSLEELNAIKNTIDPRYWNAQYMQQPTADEGAIIKREWWRQWEDLEPPSCEFILASLDAAAEKNNRADYTSITIWGVFYREDEATGERTANIILLESIRERMEFPELKDTAYKLYKTWELDAFIVEKKSAGTQLYQEMRSAGVPVSEFTPTRATGDKTARLNAVADIVRAGLVWYPRGRRWAEELVDEVAGFPSYGSDDRVDTTSMALSRFRQGGFIKLPSDRWDEDDFSLKARRVRSYY